MFLNTLRLLFFTFHRENDNHYQYKLDVTLPSFGSKCVSKC